jgi:elongator complex protein 3
VRRDYDASGGVESFLSFEAPDSDVIFAFLRLRRPSEDAHRPEVRDRNCVMIRELRVYGPVVNIGERDPSAWQHLGMGEKLIAAAEQIGQNEFEANRILVNSGIGVKPYYRALGFTDTGPYLSKNLQKK